MPLQLIRSIGIACKIVAVGKAFREQHVHDRRRQSAVRTGLEHEMDIRPLGSRRPIRINHDESCAPRFLGGGDMMHQIDLGVDRVATPHHDYVGFLYLADIDATQDTGAGDVADIGELHADGAVLA